MKRELSRKKNIVNIVWFKKDLRSSDHAPLHEAALGEYPIYQFMFLSLTIGSKKMQLSGIGSLQSNLWNF